MYGKMASFSLPGYNLYTLFMRKSYAAFFQVIITRLPRMVQRSRAGSSRVVRRRICTMFLSGGKEQILLRGAKELMQFHKI